MSFLFDKSEQNRGAFAFLSDRKLYAAAVHCGYYCCIQKIIYILKDYFSDEYHAELEKLKGGHGNRHKMYIDLFAGLCIKDRSDSRKMKSILIQLKNLRIEADYHDIEIQEGTISKVKSYMDTIQGLTRKNLKI